MPSLIGATAAVLLTAWIGNLLFGAPTGFVAAVLLAVSLILGVEARMAKIDAVLLAVDAGGAGGAGADLSRVAASRHGRGAAPAGPRRDSGWRSALGLMLKGPIILLVVLGTILLLAITERRVGWLRQLRPAWGVPLMLAVVLPWLDRDRRSPARARSLRRGRPQPARQGRDRPAIAWRAARLLPGGLSADLLAGIAVRRVRGAAFVWAKRREPAVRFCLCWIAPTWIVFELIVTKLPHYVLPTYPAIACLAAAGLLAPDDGSGRAGPCI